MTCVDLLPTSASSAWLGATLLATGIVAFAYSRSFTIEKLGAFGLEFKLQEPIRHPGYPHAKYLAVLLLAAGLVFAVGGAVKPSLPQWPQKFSDVCSADVQLSKIDDLVVVSINDTEVASAKYGETPGRTSILSLLRKGPNKVEVIVQNGPYGGCGGQVVLRLNELENTDYRWSRQKLENQLPSVVCFAETLTLDLP